MIAAVVLLVAGLAPAREGGPQRAIDLMDAGDVRGALAAADALTDPRARAEARVYVLHHAGDLEGALAAAQSGSDAYPDDALLARSWSLVALTLRRPRSAERAASRLEQAVTKLPDTEREGWRKEGLRARENTDELLRAHEQRDDAEHTARVVSFAAVGGALVALIVLAFAPTRRQRMSSTPVDASGSSKVPGGSQ